MTISHNFLIHSRARLITYVLVWSNRRKPSIIQLQRIYNLFEVVEKLLLFANLIPNVKDIYESLPSADSSCFFYLKWYACFIVFLNDSKMQKTFFEWPTYMLEFSFCLILLFGPLKKPICNLKKNLPFTLSHGKPFCSRIYCYKT